jgi:hypothetical protein
VLDDSPLEQP